MGAVNRTPLGNGRSQSLAISMREEIAQSLRIIEDRQRPRDTAFRQKGCLRAGLRN